MIYCCGLRPIEARRLRPEDVDLNTGCVKILESKGHKDRIVMLSGSILELCRRYSKKVGLIYPGRRFFFPSPSSRGEGMYSQEWIIPTFRKFLIEAGLYRHCAGNEPRLYDLRHTFATHRLYQWMKEGQDVNACNGLFHKLRVGVGDGINLLGHELLGLWPLEPALMENLVDLILA